MKLHLKVTDEDIRLGIREDCESCPIALAIKRAVPDWEEIKIDGSIYFRDSEREWTGWTKEIQEFIKAFDNGSQVYPFETTLVFEEFIREPPDPEY